MLKELFKKLHAFEELFLVGGSVRDLLIGRPVHDYDFCTPYTPNIIKEKLKECGITKTFDIGEKFGTIGCKVVIKVLGNVPPKDTVELIEKEVDVEITTFRGEQYNFVNRKPDVSYIDNIEEDVKRRDFTINSLYMSRKEAETSKGNCAIFTDKHRSTGNTDLINEVIRTVGNAGKRFKEDPLRILRAIRFASQLDFTIEEKTMAMIKRMRVELLKVSRERWTQELDKLLSCEKINFDVLNDSCVLDILIPELSYQINFDQNSKYHNTDLWTHTTNVVNAVPHTNLTLRWAALLHDIGKPFVKTENKSGFYNYIGHEIMSSHLVKQISKRLNWSTSRTNDVMGIVSTHLEKYNILKEYDDKCKLVV